MRLRRRGVCITPINQPTVAHMDYFLFPVPITKGFIFFFAVVKQEERAPKAKSKKHRPTKTKMTTEIKLQII